MNQLSFPQNVRVEEVSREKTLGGAIELCAKVAGLDLDKQLADRLKVDKARLSRWQGGTEGIVWPKFVRLMDECGNDAPLFWMLHQRGYDLHSLRRLETETERKLREANEEITALRRVLQAQSQCHIPTGLSATATKHRPLSSKCRRQSSGASMEKLRNYLKSLAPVDQTEFAINCGTSIGYLRKVLSTKALLSPSTCVRIEQVSGRVVTRRDLRPDDWNEIWPELPAAEKVA